MQKKASLILTLILVFSVLLPLANAIPGHSTEPEDIPVEFVNVWTIPRHPIGFDWADTSETGEQITLYAEIDNVVGPVQLTYSFCNRGGCLDGEMTAPPYTMTHVSGNLYSYTFAGDWGNPDRPRCYEASSSHDQHVNYSISASVSKGIVSYPATELYPAWPPSNITVTQQAPLTVYRGYDFWLNASAVFHNSSYDPEDPLNTRIPADESPWAIKFDGNVYNGKTDIDGKISYKLTAPMTTGQYTINTTVSNATLLRNVPCVSEELLIDVVEPPAIQDVSVVPDPNPLYPRKPLWLNGTATLDTGAPVTNSPVNITINGTGLSWNVTTDGTGSFSITTNAPDAWGDYTVTVSAWNNLRPSFMWNQTTLTVTRPEMKITLPETTTALPSQVVAIEGNALYLNGDIVANSDVNITIDGETGWWTGVTDSNGDFSIDITTPATAATYTINVSIDSSQYPGITDNNQSKLIVIDTPIPDLMVSGSGIEVEAANGQFAGNQVRFNVLIKNIGIENATSVLVHYLIDEELIDTDTVSIDKGDNTTTSVNWTATEGNHTFGVNVDPNNTVEESVETNNNATRNITIGTDMDGDGIDDNLDTDMDGDGVNNTDDAFPEDGNEWLDTDGDGLGNNEDADDDGDGTLDVNDDFPLDPTEDTDTDSDGLGNNEDTDDDGDGVSDSDDAFPLDGSETADADGDGVGDNADDDDDADGYLDDVDDPSPNDTDNDGVTNDYDTDDDGDGIPDVSDNYPYDTDNDGQSNEVDTDDDGDGLPDIMEVDPLKDTDGDGIINVLDPDSDGDGVEDLLDLDPIDPDVGQNIIIEDSGEEPPIVIPIVIFVFVFGIVLAITLTGGKQE